ncbi:discoidin domain-containing protein [Micromonospora sp. NPDC005203]|uniref:discoidin domain-containing protein n=1 Tax=Micromonospora sp. NPDC005203 TaxID=3364226 RepID=UPI0036A7212E
MPVPRRPAKDRSDATPTVLRRPGPVAPASTAPPATPVAPAAPTGPPPARPETVAAQPDAGTPLPPLPDPVDRSSDDAEPGAGDTPRTEPMPPAAAAPDQPTAATGSRPLGVLLRPWSVSLLLVGLVAVTAVAFGSRLPDDRAEDPTTPPGDGEIVITAGPGYGPPLPPGSGPPTAAPTSSASFPSASAPPVPAPPAPASPAPALPAPASPAATSSAAKPPGGSAPKTNGAVSGLANPSGRNLALRRPATASSSEKAWWNASYAVDGDATTRWGSVFADPQWISVDLGEVYAITTVTLNWEHAYATAYHVDVSVDGASWKRIFATTAGAAGPVLIPADKAAARFVRVTGTERVNQYGYSLWEFAVS